MIANGRASARQYYLYDGLFNFTRATGPLAKTDALDARALAYVADVIRPTPRPLPDTRTQERRPL
jgi:hypothetical protein